MIDGWLHIYCKNSRGTTIVSIKYYPKETLDWLKSNGYVTS